MLFGGRQGSVDKRDRNAQTEQVVGGARECRPREAPRQREQLLPATHHQCTNG